MKKIAICPRLPFANKEEAPADHPVFDSEGAPAGGRRRGCGVFFGFHHHKKGKVAGFGGVKYT
ncbi:MAG: hypothetical protein Q8N79_07075 [Candidatus Methanoperedens sp.]|nr:hypothetical protein [Candidatus Methanoperedens sp.]